LKILAIDTTSEQGSIAITEGDLVVEEVALESGDGFSQVLFGAIENLLERNGMRLADMDGFASASGPGTFTGVRVGLTAIKGLAEALGRKVIAVSNLKAIALAGIGELRAPVLDARRGDIYGAVYNSALEMNQDEVVMKYDAWIALLPAGAEILHGKGLLAGAIGRIAAREFAAGRAVDPALPDANYVRRADAEMAWKDIT